MQIFGENSNFGVNTLGTVKWGDLDPWGDLDQT